MKNKKKLFIRIILIIIVALGLISCGYFSYQYHLSKERNSILNGKVNEKFMPTYNTSSGIISKVSNEITGKLDHLQYNTGNLNVWNLNKNIPSYTKIKTEYDSAKVVNKDVVGWIWVKNTNINYPVEHNLNSDTFYLHHNWRNQKWWNGAIFLDKAIPSLNEHTLLIHGHNMLNSLMFAELMRFRNKNFFEQDNQIVLFDGAKEREEIFNPIGCFYATPNQEFEFNIPKDQQKKYYQYMESKSIYPVKPVNDNKFLFLNSCLSNGTHYHLIVMSQEVKSIDN